MRSHSQGLLLSLVRRSQVPHRRSPIALRLGGFVRQRQLDLGRGVQHRV